MLFLVSGHFLYSREIRSISIHDLASTRNSLLMDYKNQETLKKIIETYSGAIVKGKSRGGVACCSYKELPLAVIFPIAIVRALTSNMKTVAVTLYIYLYATHVILAFPQDGEIGDHQNASDTSDETEIEERKYDKTALFQTLRLSPGWKYLDQEQCGVDPLRRSSENNDGSSKRAFSGRIFGGIRARFPWNVRLMYQYGRFKFPACGGALISRKHVLSAAHCIDDTLRDVKLGTGQNTQTSPIKKTIIHGKYDEEKTDNDIALLILEREAKFNDYIHPICLPLDYTSRKLGGEKGIVSGWGKTETRESSEVLLMVEVPIMENKECRKLGHIFRVKPFQICAGGEAGRDSCQGDSGGPMVIQNKSSEQYSVIGVVSYGYGCGQKGLPGVYTRVTHFLTWILNHME